jgi:predicted ATP-dependent endonuclease of OLD family
MILNLVEITDFRSIKGTIKLDFDRKVTILLGSNDHGKTNILRAVEHLNDDVHIGEEETNWDAEGSPAISFSFSLTPTEKKEWRAIVEEVVNQRNAILRRKVEEEESAAASSSDLAEDSPKENTPVNKTPPAPSTTAKKPVPADDDDEDDDDDDDEEEELEAELLVAESFLEASPATIVLTRKGVGGSLQFAGLDFAKLPKVMSTFLTDKKPRVELFRILTGNLQDSVTAEDIGKDDYEFLQGVFFYAGVNPMKCADLFVQNDKTVRELDKASEQLNQSLSRLWGQGTELTFGLRHNGKTSSIEFLADDPAIKSRKARMSKRSDGVTQFFRVSMVLYGRRKKHPANSYIYLFDEPGVLLHPQGQRDLLQVFEQLADDNQIMYATHSLFLLNQNFPERHRLIFKDSEGTKVDQKPYRQNWKWATDALGVYLTSNILFSNRILLVEGDSDPMYFYELFRQLNKLDDLDVDLNSLGIMSFYDYQNLRYLLQAFRREGQDGSLFVLTDGDHEGKNFVQRVDTLCKRLDVPAQQLREGRSIEDYCLFEEQFIQAATFAIKNAFEAEGKKAPPDLVDRVQKSWDARKSIPEKPEKRTKADKDEKEERKTAGKWFDMLAKEILEDEASKIVLARTYAELCRELKNPTLNKERAKEGKALCKEIAAKLKLPPLKAAQAIEVTQ